MEVVFFVRVLGASGRTVGFVFALGALGGLARAALARRLAGRVGTARIVWVSIVAEAPFLFARPFAFSGWGVLLVSLDRCRHGRPSVVYNVAQVSHRQTVTPRRLLGRMTASPRLVVWGVMPLGALTGGVLGTLLGVRTTLLLGAVGGSLSVLWVLASPLGRVRDAADLPPELGGVTVQMNFTSHFDTPVRLVVLLVNARTPGRRPSERGGDRGPALDRPGGSDLG